MFSRKQTPLPPVPEPNGIEIRVRLSENILIKLIPLAIAILVGSGALAYHTQSTPLPADPLTNSGDLTHSP